MDQPVDVPYATIQSIPDLVTVLSGEGTDGAGHPVSIQRYVAKSTGKVYECVFTLGGEVPKCAEMPAAENPPKPE